MVLLPTRVSDAAGHPVFNLTPVDFRVLEDGKEQKLEFFALTNEPAHIALVMDTSGSTSELLPELRIAAQQFVDRFGKGDRIALYGVDTEVTRVCAFTADYQRVKEQIARMATGDAARQSPGAVVLRTGGAGTGTLLYDAIAAARQEFPLESKKRAILVFTDSWDVGSAVAFDSLSWQVLGGSEMVFAVVADLRREDDSGGKRLALLRLPKLQQMDSQGRMIRVWTLVLDLSGAGPWQAEAIEATAQEFLSALGSGDRVWIFLNRRNLHLLVSPATDGQRDRPAPPTADPPAVEEAKQLLAKLRVPENALPNTWLEPGLLRPDHVLILTDENQTGLGNLAGFVTLAPAAILKPQEMNAESLRRILTTLVQDPAGQTRLDTAALESVLELMENRLQNLAGETGGSSFHIEHAEDLNKTYQQIADQIRSSFLLGYYTSGSSGMRRLEVSVPGRAVRVNSRRAVVIVQ